MSSIRFGRRLGAAAAGFAVVAGAVAVGGPAQAARQAATSVDTTYLSDTLGVPAQNIIETVTYDRFQWLLQQSGQFAFLIGSTTDPGFAADAKEAEAAARAAGATKLYWFDPNLSGYTGARSLDIRNSEAIALADASQAIYKRAWDNILGRYLGNGISAVPSANGSSVTIAADDAVVNDSVDPLFDARTGATDAVAADANLFVLYDKDRVVAGAADKVASWVDLGGAASVTESVTGALATIDGGAATVDQLDQFAWWKSSANRKHDLAYADDARYGGDILEDSDAAEGWRVQQITYPELLHLLSLKDSSDQNFAILFGGTWCHNTRAVLKQVNAEAQENGVTTVYNFDLVLDGGTVNGTNGGSNPLHVRDNAASGSTFDFRPSYLYGDLVRTYLRNLVTEYDPNTGNRVAYYPNGDLTAFPDVVRKLQVPFLVNYQRGTGTNPSATSIKRQWIQQNVDASTGLPTFKEYMSEWWFTQPSAQLGLNFAIPADESTLTSAQQTQLTQARANAAFGADALAKLDRFFGGLPGGVTSTRTVTAADVAYGERPQVTVAIANDYGRVPTGSATIEIAGTSAVATVTENAAVFDLDVLTPGTYPFTVTYPGDAQVAGFTETGSLTVTKAAVAKSTGTVVKAPTTTTGGSYKVAVSGPSGLAVPSGAVTVTLTSGTATAKAVGTLSGGVATLTLPKVAAGKWTAKVAYAGDARYSAKTVTGASVTAVKAKLSALTGAVAKLPTSAATGAYSVVAKGTTGQPVPTGKVTVTLTRSGSTVKVTGTLVSGKFTITVPKLAKGTWSASLSYTGDSRYAAGTSAGAAVKVTR